MKKREKILALGLLVTLLAGVGYRYAPRASALLLGTKELAEEAKALRDLQDKNDRSVFRFVEGYRELGLKTLGREPDTAKNRLDAEIKKLVTECAMLNPRYTPKHVVSTRKTNMYIIPYTVSAEGRLQDVISFLGKFYDRPYLWTIQSLTLSPVEAKAKDLVKLNADIETIVLPSVDLDLMDASGKPMDPLKEYEVADPEKVETKLDADALASAYGDLWAEQFFTPYRQPPPPPPSTPTTAPTRVVEAPRSVVQPMDPGLAQTKINGVLIVNGEQEVVTHNIASNQRKYLGVGEELAGGRIILVHRSGVVVCKNSTNYFYPLGGPLNAGKVLSEEEYPEIFDAVTKLAQR